MLKVKRLLIIGLTTGLGALVATPAFSGSISLKDAGVPLWIFIIIGGMVVLFQLIPAAILFFSFFGTTTLIIFKLKNFLEGLPAREKEKVVLPGYERTIIKKTKSSSERYEM